MPYEYMPPHGNPRSLNKRPGNPSSSDQKWQVVIPWGSTNFTEEVYAASEAKALRKVVMHLSTKVNMTPNLVFQRVYHERQYKVSVCSSFCLRANHLTVASDLERLRRLPHVESAEVYSKNGAQIEYAVIMPQGNTLVDLRDLTGYIQNTFGARLRSSGPLVLSKNGKSLNAIKVRISLLQPVDK